MVDLRQLFVRLAAQILQQEVGLRDELHIGVLDAVVHHLHVVSCAVRTDIGAAWLAIHMCRDRFENGADGFVECCTAARHQRRAEPCALLTARNAHAKVVELMLLDELRTTDRILKEGVAAVDDDIPRLHHLQQGVNHHVHRFSRLYHQNNAARLLERMDEVL